MLKDVDSEDFRHRLYTTQVKRGMPVSALFELTYRCNYSCIHCHNAKDGRKELETSQVLSLIDQLADAGCIHIGFTGGEPFMRDDFFEILKHSARDGLRITILTNGSLLDEDAIKAIKEIKPSINKVDVSLLASTQENYRRITCSDTFDKVIDSIRLLAENDIPVMVKTTAMRENLQELKGIKEISKRYGTMFKISPRVHPRADGDLSPITHRVEGEQAIKFMEEIGVAQPTVDGQHEKSFFNCDVGVTETVISPYGELKVCPSIDKYKIPIKDLDFLSAWELQKDLVRRLNDSKSLCSGCELMPSCTLCQAKMSMEYESQSKCRKHSSPTDFC